ncbi:diguanylate cyclase [Agrobacterium sp. a22-2]|uniref:diguanylate cyclase n=1 Tax=Agrobacterium sp. a22-2 TaxID=2283840 RepID=UPI00144574AC|nr:diguanylate cyclase [Agrobacterium sp. a22-2]NKN36317.1 diguanylate cyclase [Agrobacterium sp. a22-2]
MSFSFDVSYHARKTMFESCNVLLIEDSRSIASVLSHRLAVELGTTVTHCASTKALREAIVGRGRKYDIAVVDLNLPDSPNGEVLDMAVEQGIPVIVFTATFNLDMRERIVERGVSDYIIKDNDRALDMVVASVERVLSNRAVRILVVDDVASARRHLVELLTLQQFSVLEASTGTQALDMLRQHSDISLVLTDYNMPDMDGYELTRRIRRSYDSSQLRVIGISSSSDRLLSASFLKAGACDFVYRPYVAEELQCRINQNIETLSQIRQLREAAFNDYLTGLYNRRYFFEQGPVLIDNCLGRHTPCSVAMLDIDHFKKLNDTYGHEGGDRVLKAVALKLKSLLSEPACLLGRLGGEEFGLLLPGVDSAEATVICEKIRHALSEIKVAVDDKDVAITVSIGIAEVGGRESFDNYLNAADQFLYLAKRYGRNQVYSDRSIVAEPVSRASGS